MTEQGTCQLLPGTTTREADALVRAQTTIVWHALYVGAPIRASG